MRNKSKESVNVKLGKSEDRPLRMMLHDNMNMHDFDIDIDIPEIEIEKLEN